MRTSQQANSPPPCVENWYTRPKRTFDWTRQGITDRLHIDLLDNIILFLNG